MAINLALTCIAQNAKRIKTVLAYSFGCVVFSLEALISVWPAYLLCLRLLVGFCSVWLRSFQLRDANLVFRPPISYFVLASFFAISTLRLTGLAARGLRYRSCSSRLEPSLNGQCSSPSIATASACRLKTILGDRVCFLYLSYYTRHR